MKALRIIALVIAGLLLLIFAAITVAVNYLKPERLTPLVERVAGDYLNADVSLRRVEISFYSTFPQFVLDMRGLEVRSKALDSLPDHTRRRLPVYADSLLSLRGLNAAVNIPRLLTGSIELYDVILTSPRINIVQATPEVSSMDIFPAGGKKKDDKKPSVPDISFDTFRVDSALTARYFSLPDSVEAMGTLRALDLEGEKSPLYALDIQGSASASLPAFTLPATRVGLNGRVDWRPDEPLALGLDNFKVSVEAVELIVNSRLSFESPMRVSSLSLTLPQTSLSALTRLIPAGMPGELEKIDANLTIGVQARLTAPFTIGVDSLPSLAAVVEIPEGSASYDGMKLDKFSLLASAEIDGGNPDGSTLNIDRLMARGEGMGFALEGTVTRPLTDPEVSGIFKGGVSFAHLPKTVTTMLPGTVKGLLRADCSFTLRRSWLTADNFHKIKLKGEATLTNLNIDMPALPVMAYARNLELKLGTSSSFTRGERSVDSLLTVSLKTDTLSADLTGMKLHLSNLALGVGCKNTGSSSDTTLINPIGGRLTVGRLSFRSQADSLRVFLGKASAGFSLRRFKGEARRPQMSLNISADKALYADAINRAFLTDASAAVTVYPSTSTFNTRRLNRLDSLRRANPTLSRDSLLALDTRLRRERRGASGRLNRPDSAATANNALDLEVDGSIRRLLRLWETRGGLRAARVTAFTPMFPLRSRVTGLTLRFNSDSVTVIDTRIRVGRSDFVLDGKISNITRALTSRNGSQHLKLNFAMRSDTINVNEIAAAVFAGAAWAEKNRGGDLSVSVAPDDISEEAIGPDTDQLSKNSAAVLVIPANIEATFDISASNIIYSDLIFSNFHGSLNAYEGALNLSELSARTDVGSINLNALYSATSVRDASFALGMRINDFHIREFLNLMPAIDSLMPLLGGISGIINANLAATTAIDSCMNIDIPSLKAAVKISGDSLVVIDEETFKSIGKWLLFKHKERNMIDSMTVEMIINNSQLQMFPFIFDFDRYKLGISGSNDMAMNFNYHVAVLKSPLPFKFGINVSGNPDKLKIRLGRAKFNEKNMARTISIADTTRINLVNEIRNVFRRGVSRGRLRQLEFDRADRGIINAAEAAGDTISHADSLYFINQGVLPAPPAAPDSALTAPKKKSKRSLFRR